MKLPHTNIASPGGHYSGESNSSLFLDTRTLQCFVATVTMKIQISQSVYYASLVSRRPLSKLKIDFKKIKIDLDVTS